MMRDSIIFESFKKHITKYTDSYLICPVCNKPFCNKFGEKGVGNCCNVCQDKQISQFGNLFCGETTGLSSPTCTCGQHSTIEKNILILYLITLTDYIDNLEYQLVCKEEGRNYNETI